MSPNPLAAFLTATACIGLGACATGCAPFGSLPHAPVARTERPSSDERAIERQEVCIGSSVASAGALSDVLYYRAVRTSGGQLAVGYFVFFSEERPWGNNWMTWTLVPALVIDVLYSHALLVGPGIVGVTKGKGDVEGVRIFYDVREDGSLTVDRAVADDGAHSEVDLSRADLYALDPERPIVYSDVWSHQLGAKSARTKADLVYLRCYRDRSLRPLPDDVAREYHADDRGRAGPAHVEALAELRSPTRSARAESPRTPRTTAKALPVTAPR